MPRQAKAIAEAVPVRDFRLETVRNILKQQTIVTNMTTEEKLQFNCRRRKEYQKTKKRHLY